MARKGEMGEVVMSKIVLAALAALVVAAPAKAVTASSPRCPKLYTQVEYRHYAKLVLERETISQRSQDRLAHMRICQHSSKATANVSRYIHRLRIQRWRRLHYWDWQRSQLSSVTRGMLVRLRSCETRGIPFPNNYQYDGHHDGAYQYDYATWHEAGGSGYAYQATPAEQDVRTAWFYPSHRGRWQCSA